MKSNISWAQLELNQNKCTKQRFCYRQTRIRELNHFYRIMHLWTYDNNTWCITLNWICIDGLLCSSCVLWIRILLIWNGARVQQMIQHWKILSNNLPLSPWRESDNSCAIHRTHKQYHQAETMENNFRYQWTSVFGQNTYNDQGPSEKDEVLGVQFRQIID